MTNAAGLNGERPGIDDLLVHRAFLMRLATSLLRDGAAAEDVVQSTYVRAFEARAPGFEIEGPRAWLGRIVRRLAHNSARDARRRLDHERARAAHRPEAGVPSAAEIVHRETVRRQVVDAVGQLAEPYRSAVLLRYFEGLEAQDIARRFRVDPSTVRSRLQRAREMLRERLDRQAGGDRGQWATALVPLCGPTLHAAESSIPLAWCLSMVRSTAVSSSTMKLGLVLAGATLLVSLAWMVHWSVLPESGPPSETVPLATDIASHDGVPAWGAAEPSDRAEVPTWDSGQPVAEESPVAASVLRAMTGFRGRVVDDEGRAVPGIRVGVLRAADDAWAKPDFGEDRIATGFAPSLRAGTVAETGDDGRFVVSGVPPGGVCVVRLERANGEAGVARSVWVDRMPGPGEIQDLGDLPFAICARIVGRVIDADGVPVANARVVATDLPAPYVAMVSTWFVADPDAGLFGGAGELDVWPVPDWFRRLREELPTPSARADADGRFVLETLGPGRWSVICRADGWGTTTRDGIELAGAEVVRIGDVVLPAAAGVSGKIVDGDGRPIVDAEVLIVPEPVGTPFAFAVERTRSGADGHFEAPRVAAPRGSALRVAARRAGAWTLAERSAPGSPVRVVLPASRTLEVEVTGGGVRAGSRIRCEVHAGRGPGLARRLEYGAVERVVLDRIPATDDPGHGLRFSAELDAGRYTLRIWDGAGLAHEEEVVLGSDRQCQVVIPPAGFLDLQVFDRTGGAVHGARVVVEDHDGVRRRLGETGVQGQMRIATRPPGVRRVEVWHPAHGSVGQVFEPTRTVGIATLIMGGQGGVVGSVVGVPRDGGRAWTVIARADGQAMPRLAAVDESDGTFEMHGLEPARYVLSIARLEPASLGGVLALASGFDAAPAATTVVTVEPDRTESVTLDLAAAMDGPAGQTSALRGRVILDGQPAEGIRIHAVSAADGAVAFRGSTDATGRFDLGRMPAPGRYFVDAFDVDQRCFADNQPHMQWSGWVGLEVGEDVDLTISVDSASIAGTVLDANGDPIVAALVVARGRLDAEPRTEDDPTISTLAIEAATDGTFRFDGVPPGIWSVDVRVPGRRGVHAASEGHALVSGQRLHGLVLRVR